MPNKKSSEQQKDRSSQIHIEINPWPVFWTLVGADIWFGILRLAHIV